MRSVDQNIESKSISLNNLKVRGATWNVYLLNFGLYFGLKLWFRPWVKEQEGLELIKLIANSFPNYVEAYMGTFTIAGLLIIGRLKGYSWVKNLSDIKIYTISATLAAIYVISQEMKFHNLGGANIYDPNDVIASIIGLAFIFVMLNIYGIKLIKD